jgi:Protein of unknown function (DUF1496)
MRSTLLRAGAAVGGLFAALGAAAVLATPASAETSVIDPNEPVVAEGCVYAGQQYSEGAIIKVGDRYIECVFGRWTSA